MAKLTVMQNVNGYTSIVSEWDNNDNGAFVSFYNTCANLQNSSEVIYANVKVMDEALNPYPGKSAYIEHPVEPEPEPEPEPEA